MRSAVFLGFLALVVVEAQDPPAGEGPPVAEHQHGKVEAIHTFSGPFDSKKSIPFWNMQGGAEIAEDNYVRLTTTTGPGLKGAVWNSEPMFSINWEVELEFRASGGRYMGGDGMAFWYTAAISKEGAMFGSDEKFKGLAVYFDSYDNDGQRDNPVIAAMVSDGNKFFDHQTDGKYTRLEGASCKINYRNARLPVTARITYVNSTLTVQIDTKGTGAMLLCFEAEDVHLVKGGYIGVSAQTGEVADNHDVYAIKSYSMDAHDIHEQMAEAAKELSDPERPFLKRTAHSFYRFLKLNEHDRQHYFAVRKVAFEEARARKQEERDNPRPPPPSGVDYTDSSSSSASMMSSQVVDKIMTELAYMSEKVQRIQATVDNVVAAHDHVGSTAVAPAADGAAAPAGPNAGKIVAQITKLKTDIEASLTDTISKQRNEMTTLKSEITELKNLLKGSAGRTHEIELSNKLGTLANDVVKLKGKLDDTHEHHQTVASEVKDHIVTLHSTLQAKSSAFGFWTYFIFFQVMFAVGFLYWRRMQEQSRKLL